MVNSLPLQNHEEWFLSNIGDGVSEAIEADNLSMQNIILYSREQIWKSNRILNNTAKHGKLNP